MNERDRLLRELDDARALLLAATDGLPDADFGRPMADGAWTPEDLLNHVTAWDAYATAAVAVLVTGRPTSAPPVENEDAWNEAAVAPLRGRPPTETLAALHAARDAFRAALEAAPATLWTVTPRTGAGGQGRNLPGIVRAWAEHDAEHAAELRAFRDRAAGSGPQGP